MKNFCVYMDCINGEGEKYTDFDISLSDTSTVHSVWKVNGKRSGPVIP